VRDVLLTMMYVIGWLLCGEGAGDDHCLEKSLGHVSAWLHDSHANDLFNRGLFISVPLHQQTSILVRLV